MRIRGWFFLLTALSALAQPAQAQPAGVPEFPTPCGLAAERLLVPVLLNGTGPHTFVLDLGLKRPVLHGATATALRLTPRTLDPLPGSPDAPEEETPPTVTEVGLFQAGGLPPQPETVAVADLNPLSARLGVYVAGLLPAHQPGFEVTLAFDPPSVTWRPLEFGLLLDPNTRAVPLRLGEDGMPVVEARVNGTDPRECRIDLAIAASAAFTGATLADLNARGATVKQLRLLLPGDAVVEQLRLGTVSVGGAVATRPVCQVAPEASGDRLGAGFVRQFPLTLNYEYGLARFDAADGEGREEAPLTGFGVLPAAFEGGFWRVAVVEESPAWQAGVRPGDFLLGANGLSLRQVTWNDLARLLAAQPGLRTRLLIGRDGQQQFIETIAAELL